MKSLNVGAGSRYASSRHRIITPPAFHACGDSRVVVVTEHKISVPLRRDSADRDPEEIDLFFTITELMNDGDEDFFQTDVMMKGSAEDRALAYTRHFMLQDMDDSIIYLQGGPGFGAPTPACGIGLSSGSSWVGQALSKGFKRVILMDQRGTGRSTPITKQTLQKRFPDLFALDSYASTRYAEGKDIPSSFESFCEIEPDLAGNGVVALETATEYMTNFRADNIVVDAEAIREALLVPAGTSETPRPWGAALGQSFGGFCMMSYLSLIPQPPRACLLTGGIAPMLTSVDKAYDSLWEKVKERSLSYYDAYPGDIGLVKRIVRALLAKPANLPSGGVLTARRFLQLGLSLGGSPSAFASLHSTLSSAFIGEEDDEFSKAFLKGVDTSQPFDDHPIYFLLHESIYADAGIKRYLDGGDAIPTNWSAHRMFENRIKTPSEFSYELTAGLDSDSRPTLFFGEMVFPWMADGDYAELSGLGMKSLAHALANKSDWGVLYDSEKMRSALANGAKAAAAVYYDDMYVDFDSCMKVVGRGGPLEKCKVWVTNEYQHSGLRDNGSDIFSKILGMAKGSVRTPS
eukprot:CAMPEP_0116021112 /NCGR_PEP_ID=MMETSP0321-20121206/10194_1 /TAXON_ID=163516 /ORGANISM="Leptocylindrus danicus var. danicus, Strain B650" /LENGTH=573 /DNA_ID=CAMNT_0003491923 /DNA_START=280 /DNA_END=2001 /DNA_ORIENTATION=+